MFTLGSIKMIKEIIVSSINNAKTSQGKCIVSTNFLIIFVT